MSLEKLKSDTHDRWFKSDAFKRVDSLESTHLARGGKEFQGKETIPQFIDKVIDESVVFGRISVLEDFDNMCKADAFMGFTTEEWAAIRKFFTFNKSISGWDK